MVESSGTSPPIDYRVEAAKSWLRQTYDEIGANWQPITGDASYRRYFRTTVNGESRIVMDAPPELEDSAPFIDISKRLRARDLHAPEIFQYDLEQGFLLLEDLGDGLYKDLINEHTVQALFDQTFPAMAVMAKQVSDVGLPAFDEDLLHDELNWFTDLYLGRHKGLTLRYRQRKAWLGFCEELVAAAFEQPQVFVHKDIHSCNLMQTRVNSPGIIDFQDAVKGPLTYDFVSLVWDRYIHWPRPKLEQWMEQFRLLVSPGTDAQTWMYWCDLMGLQRNIKIVGRFALLRHVQEKHGYIEMIPMFYRYILDVLPRYPQFSEITDWLRSEECAP